MTRVALISMPWRRPNNAAIGLASLKAVAMGAGASACDVHYLSDAWFQHIRHELSQGELARASFSEFSRVVSELAGVIQAGEWVFSQNLFKADVAGPIDFEASFRQATRGNVFAEYQHVLVQSASLVDTFLEQSLKSVDWNAYDIIGFSCVFYQLCPSLLLASRLRDHGFGGNVVFGGPLVEGVVGRQVLRLFPYVDFVFDGEAEKSFGKFIENSVQCKREPSEVPGIWYRDGTEVRKSPGDPSVPDMNLLPIPDYSDFFALMAGDESVDISEVAFPLEGSRGCWWGQRHHCIFCGLNGADMTHRMKTAERIFTELTDLHERYKVGHFAFTDNIISPKFIRPLMGMLSERQLPVTFHAEIKSNLSQRQIRDYRSAGFIYLQPGIESLSSRVLEIMDKGVTALANIACLKYCREMGIRPFWNLLFGFPGETSDDYRQILARLPFLVHLDPPEVVTPMRLTRFSPSFTRSEELGFFNPRPASFYHLIFPYSDAELQDLVNSFEFDFHDDVPRERLGLEMAEFIREWKRQDSPGSLVYDPAGEPGEGGVLYDSRYTRKRDERRLNPLEDRVFQLCFRPLSLSQLLDELRDEPSATEASVCQILESLEGDMFVLRDGDAALSLALTDSSFIPWQAIGALEQFANMTDARETALGG